MSLPSSSSLVIHPDGAPCYLDTSANPDEAMLSASPSYSSTFSDLERGPQDTDDALVREKDAAPEVDTVTPNRRPGRSALRSWIPKSRSMSLSSRPNKVRFEDTDQLPVHAHTYPDPDEEETETVALVSPPKTKANSEKGGGGGDRFSTGLNGGGRHGPGHPPRAAYNPTVFERRLQTGSWCAVLVLLVLAVYFILHER